MPVVLAGILFCLPSCRQDDKPSGKMTYYDIAGNVKQEITHLQQSNPVVTKTVGHNGVSATKKVKISKWENELSLFASSDINKPAWRNSYQVLKDSNVIIYKAKDPELRTREIMIKTDGQKLKWMVIFNHTSNMLYTTSEKLSYFPDSLYMIEKSQKVRFLGINRYQIKDELN